VELLEQQLLLVTNYAAPGIVLAMVLLLFGYFSQEFKLEPLATTTTLW